MQIEQLTNDLHYAVALMEAFHLTSSPPYTQLKDLARDLEYCELVRYSPDAGRYALALLTASRPSYASSPAMLHSAFPKASCSASRKTSPPCRRT